MQRRNFVKKSVAAAIVAATPLALTGLVKADGGGETGSTSTDSTYDSTDYSSTDGWETTNSSTEDTTVEPCTFDADQEFRPYKDENLENPDDICSRHGNQYWCKGTCQYTPGQYIENATFVCGNGQGGNPNCD